jgi:hypothetical protein
MLSQPTATLNTELSHMRPKSPPNPPQNAPDAVSIALKRMHQNVITEDVPKDFADLLAAIGRKIETGESDR